MQAGTGTNAGGDEGESVDDYRLVRALGSGEATFLAHDRVLDRPVVLTFLPTSPAARAEALQVARAFARVSHPNLGRVHRVRQGGGRPYLVAAFLRGVRLSDDTTAWTEKAIVRLGVALTGALRALHAEGVAHGAVGADRVFLTEDGEACLVGQGAARVGGALQERDAADVIALLSERAPESLRSRLASLVPAGGTVPTMEAIHLELLALAAPALPSSSLADNPYRGLRSFEREHAAEFFGREEEVTRLTARLRGEPWLVVAGRSGAGKSSLARAGVGRAVADGALGECKTWAVVTFTPGARPISSLAHALDTGSREAPPGTGLLMIVDQLEEIFTLADEGERVEFLRRLQSFGSLRAGVRLIATLRSDFLDRLVEVGELGRGLARAAFLLPPMREDGLREAILAPARARGFAFESPAMVDALMAGARVHAEALPLLSFALAELWTARDEKRRILPRDALDRWGGVAGALGAHADIVLATLGDEERREARRILLLLVSAAATRQRRTDDDLLGSGGAPARAALDALVAGRLVVAGETYEIAHEALAQAWPRLRGWTQEASESQAASTRLEAAAREWVRLGRAADGLAPAALSRDLQAATILPGLGEDARAFVAASLAAQRRAGARRWATRFRAPLAVLALVALTLAGVVWSEGHRRRAFVRDRLGEADEAMRLATALEAEVESARAEAFARFDQHDDPGGESHWKAARDLARRQAEAFATASAATGRALSRDPDDATTRARESDVTSAWLHAAERDGESEVARELSARLSASDPDGWARRRVSAPARLRVTTTPPADRLELRSIMADAPAAAEGRLLQPGQEIPVDAGSYVVVATLAGRPAVRLPIAPSAGELEVVNVPIPAAERTPPGFVFIPAGTSLIGTASEGLRSRMVAIPRHPVTVPSFFMAAYEVTNRDYLRFLDAQPPERRRALRSGWLESEADGGAVLILADGTRIRGGEPLCHPARSARRCQDWMGMPVVRVTPDDARAYAAWVSTTTARGARLCTSLEWERAARGADGRLFPWGNVMVPTAANIRSAYNDDALQMGTDEPGAFPGDVGPFGVHDQAGNVTEWVDSQTSQLLARGASWRSEPSDMRFDSRFSLIFARYVDIGIRLCADFTAGP